MCVCVCVGGGGGGGGGGEGRGYGGMIASFPGAEEGERESAWYTLFAHAHNYSKSHVVELGACTNMTINGSYEQHKLS